MSVQFVLQPMPDNAARFPAQTDHVWKPVGPHFYLLYTRSAGT